MFSCKKASRLISDSMDRPLRPRERLAMRLHLLICRVCRRFNRQARFLESARPSDEWLERLNGETGLPPDSRARILEALRREQNRDS